MRSRNLTAIPAVVAALIAISCPPVNANQVSSSAPDPITDSDIVFLTEDSVDALLEPGDEPGTAQENQAVAQYLESLPAEGSYLTEQDVEVGSVDVSDDISATIVAPTATVEVQSVEIALDAGSNEITATAQTATVEEPMETSGAGMGSWPNWEDSPSWAVVIKLYDNHNYVGEAYFQTQRREYRDNNTDRDIWQVARRARATPDEIEVGGPLPDVAAYVKKLWVSSRLTPKQQPFAQQWRQDLTNPDAGFTSCSDSGASVTAGPFTFTPSNCADYSVWQGDIGHMRFDYDQGSYAGGESRAIAFVSGFQMDENRGPWMTWYQFLTLRLGHYGGQPELKCTNEELGIENGTLQRHCDF